MKPKCTGVHRSSGSWTEVIDHNSCTDGVGSAVDPEFGIRQNSGHMNSTAAASKENCSACYNPLNIGISDDSTQDHEIFSHKALNQFQSFCQFWFIADFFAVGLFAFGGVAMRMAIGNALTNQVTVDTAVNTGPFFQAFCAEPYLASNMVGSFCMALCVAFACEVTAVSPALHKGIATGFCGSLTTLSSWMYDGFDQRFNSSNWFAMFIVVLLEFYLTWASFTMGLAIARLARDIIAHPQVQQYLRLSQHQNVAQLGTALEAGELPSSPNDDLSAHTEISSSQNSATDTEMSRKGSATAFSDREKVDSVQVNEGSGLLANKWYGKYFATIKEHEYSIWSKLFCLVAGSLWIVLLAVPYMSYFNNDTYRRTYRSVALAPFGAWLRWALTRFPSIKALWPEMHPQTLIANIAAVTIMSAITVSSTSAWVAGVDAGLCGSLSTVSTFMVELHTLYKEGGPWISLRYAVTTVLLSVTIIQVARTAAD